MKVIMPEPGAGLVDKSKPFDLNNMIPCKHDSPALLDRQLALFDDDNDNTVVYRGKTANHKITEADPVEVYWMGFSRKDPKEMDVSKLRDELNWIEKKVAYGASGHRHGHIGDEFEIKLVAVPSLKTVMKYHGNRLRLTGTLAGRQCFITRVYVMAKENMIGLPTVVFVNIHGIDIETGEEIVEKISP